MNTDKHIVIILGFTLIQFMSFLLSLKWGISDYFENERFKISQEKRRFEYEMKQRKINADTELRQEKARLRNEVREQKKNMQEELAVAKQEYREQKTTLNNQFRELKKQLLTESKNVKLLADQRVSDAETRAKEMYALLSSSSPFTSCAEMMADIFLTHYFSSEDYLRHKPHPAIQAANEVKILRKETKSYFTRMKELEYKLSYIIKRFPDIEIYTNNDEDLLSLKEAITSSDEIMATKDNRKDYLSQEEYQNLTETQKSQLALDRYVQSRTKNKWSIGRDYEMSCAFQMEADGYSVEMNGIKLRMGDLGRDLIAKKNNGDIFGNEVLIIQCKNWSRHHLIRENVIMQLLGTKIEYEISHNNVNQEVTPVLMIPPYSQLSETALQFADKLKVRILRLENKDFPRIKCNINNGQKIYHLPFDQQYDRTEIKLTGECYVWTVAEAESKGFRRAMRYNFNN